MKIQETYYRVGKSPFVYIGYNCNNNCIFCFEDGREFSKKTTNGIKKEMETIRQNFDFINFMGQEPTLRSDVVDLVGFAKDLGFKNIGITTNGRMFAYKKFTQDILNSGLNQVVFTVVGGSAEGHDLHTLAKGSFDQALAGIKNVLLLKKPEVSAIVNIMVTKNNFKELVDMVDFYVGLGVKEINIGHIMPLNKKIENSKKMIAKMSEVVPLLIECQNKYSDRVKFLFVEYPACIFPKEFGDLAFPCLEENPQKKRISICQKCDHNKKCLGISKSYLKLYGDKEFSINN